MMPLPRTACAAAVISAAALMGGCRQGVRNQGVGQESRAETPEHPGDVAGEYVRLGSSNGRRWTFVLLPDGRLVERVEGPRGTMETPGTWGVHRGESWVWLRRDHWDVEDPAKRMDCQIERLFRRGTALVVEAQDVPWFNRARDLPHGVVYRFERKKEKFRK